MRVSAECIDSKTVLRIVHKSNVLYSPDATFCILKNPYIASLCILGKGKMEVGVNRYQIKCLSNHIFFPGAVEITLSYH